MTTYSLIALDAVAILILTFGLYFPRHRRRSMIVAFMTVNVAVVAVSVALASSAIDMGIGLGLFGILSIIRLRSSELDQHEVAYYFAALALGLLAGLGSTMGWIVPFLMIAILAALYVGDHPSMFAGYRRRTMIINRAISDDRELVGYLEDLLGVTVHRVRIKKVDFVNDGTSVEVRLELPRDQTSPDAPHRLASAIGPEQ